MHTRILLGAACLFSAAGAQAASFDCTKAASRVEKAICANKDLSALDEHMGRYYQWAREYFATGIDCLKTDQKAWLTEKRDACETDDCLQTAYLERLSALDAIQPGGSAIQDKQLPAQPSLMWIVPPATDLVAAPLRSDASPLEAIGTLVDERSSGVGFSLKTSEGVSHPFALLMLAQPSFTSLAELSWQRHNRFQVRGYRSADKEKPAFEPSRCAFVYRMP